MSEAILPNELFQFLSELKCNNQRDWFSEHKSRYQSQVLLPSVNLVSKLEKPLQRSAPMLSVVPKKHGGSVMRIYRDTRFSKDKTPYKTHVGLSIRHQAGSDIHAPGIYIHLEPGNCFLGAGCWRPERGVLSAIRSAIDQDPKGWCRARDQTIKRTTFQLGGDRLKTSPQGFSRDHEMIGDLRRIDFIALAPLDQAELVSARVVSILVDRIREARSLMRFLCEAIDLPY